MQTYIELYAICFMVTVIQLMLIVTLGSITDNEEGIAQDDSHPIRQWIGYILKSCGIAFIVSFAAPVVLAIYFIFWIIIVIAILTGER